VSIVNFTLDSQRALIAVDTVGGGYGLGEHQVSKIYPVAHANIILAGRGSVSFLAHVAVMCSVMQGDFDQMIVEVAELLPRVWAQMLSGWRAQGLDGSVAQGQGQELYLFGYSCRLQEMVAVCFTRLAGGSVFAMVDDLAYSAAPYPTCLGVLPPIQTVQDFMPIARKQVQLHRETCPDAGVGGRLLLAKLTRESMTLKSLGEIEPKHVLVGSIMCPTPPGAGA
jgi:hypothetical protein